MMSEPKPERQDLSPEASSFESTPKWASPSLASGAPSETTAVAQDASAPAADAPIDLPSAPVPAWYRPFDLTLFFLLLVLAFALGAFAAHNPDVFLHLATGKAMAEGTYTFGVDPFTWWTGSDGEPLAWVHHSWLYSWALYQLVQVADWLPIALKASLLSAVILTLWFVRLESTDRWIQVMLLTLAALSISTRFFLQPVALSCLFLSLTLLILHHAGAFRSDGCSLGARKKLWLLPPLFALWANLDQWFILGPLTLGVVALAISAARLGRLFAPPVEPGQDVPAPAAAAPPRICRTTLLMVFLVSLAACMLNPHTYRVFSLPGELALPLVAVTEAVGLQLPDALVGAGRTLMEVSNAQPTFRFSASILSTVYFLERNTGMSLAGWSIFPLLAFGAIAFAMSFVMRHRPDAPPFDFVRFVLWLVFVVMAVLNYRMLLFTAVVSAPMAALTLSEVFAWQRRTTERRQPLSWAAPSMSRMLSGVLMVGLLVLAWPGWLGGIEANQYRRVAFDIRPDPSMVTAAKELGALHARNEGTRVLNLTPDFGSYCAYYAPGVKTAFDVRFHVFGGVARPLTEAQDLLLNPQKRKQEAMAALLVHRIDHVAVQPGLGTPQPAVGWFWGDRAHWRPRYTDNRIAVFAYSPQGLWNPDQPYLDLRRQAFGDAAGQLNAGEINLDAVAVNPFAVSVPDFSEQYWKAAPQDVQPFAQLTYLRALNGYVSRQFPLAALHGQFVGLLLGSPYFTSTLPGSYAGPGQTLVTCAPYLVATLPDPNEKATQQADPNKVNPQKKAPTKLLTIPEVYFTHLASSHSVGEPAIPVLQVRLARRAVQNNRLDWQAFELLAGAYENLAANQEELWLPQPGHNLREQVRKVQIVAALMAAVQLAPENFDLHHRLAQFFEKQHYLDMALEHATLARQSLERVRPTEPQQAKVIEARLEYFRGHCERLESEVQRRTADYERIADAQLKVGQKVQLALVMPYRFVDETNRPQEDPQGRGLIKVALKALLDEPPQKLSPAERNAVVHAQAHLLLQLGQTQSAFALLSTQEQALGRAADDLFVLYHAAVGNYNAALGRLKGMHENLGYKARREAVLGFMPLPTLFSAAAQPAIARPFTLQLALGFSLGQMHELGETRGHVAELKTLAGVLAIEQGNTALAQDLLSFAAREGETFRFPDWPLASRYAHLLAQARK